MKKGNITILASIFIMTLVAAGASVGTQAYFSSTETAGITFAAGTPNLRLSKNNGGSWGDSLTVDFPVWAPGDTYALEIWVKNIGNIGLANLYVTGDNLGGSNIHLAEHIFVTKIGYTDRHPNNYQYWVYPSGGTYYADINRFGGSDGKMSVTELASGLTDGEFMKFCWGDGVTVHGDYLPAGAAMVQKFSIEFTFDANAGNEWQGKSCSFDLVFRGSDEPFTPVWTP
ncbi:MAG: hypothetical protein D4S01_09395 [Dehalococcoidia bacterium]|nr:MAG: hypothetical protein D4S01_09395 [Dehalococcoidia bacterium]